MKKTLIRTAILLLTVLMMFSSCKKKKGADGADGVDGRDGANGKSAYELAQAAGFEGTLEEWLVSLVGAKGEIGAEVTDISLLSSNGLTDTYQITFSNGATQTFDVKNGEVGVGITDISLDSTEGSKDTYVITLSDGSTKSFTITNGAKGDKGDTGADGKSAYDLAVEQGFKGDIKAWLLSLVGEKGDIGAEVSSVLKTETSGLTDTYTIVFSNGFASTFTVTNANSIVKIEKTASSGLTDIYTITMTDGTTFPFTVTNGAKGDKGDTGATGPKGDTGATGPKGDKGEQGAAGLTVEFRVNDGWLQWKYTNEEASAWKNLYETDGTPPPTGLVAVRLILNGGSLNGSAETIHVTSGTSIELPTPQKHGYTFMGWYANVNDEYAVPNEYRVHESTNLYAKWEAGAIITGTKIYNLNDFTKIKNNLGGTYVLMNDIDCEGLALPIIGESDTNSFRGIFEGQGYTISNYTVSPNRYMGLFGYSTGTIRNLNVSGFDYDIENANTSSSVFVGGIAGYNAGTIEKCSSVRGNIYISLTNERRGGLIAGESSGTIKNCFADGTVRIEQPNDVYNWAIAGGIVATNRGEISNCFVSATLYAYGYGRQYQYTGGTSNMGEAAIICGANEKSGVITNCVVMGSVLKGNHRVGDISGRSDGTITNCYKDTNTSIVQNSGTVYSYATAQSLSNMSKSAFYSVSLGWDSSIWNFNNIDISNGIYPTLKQN